MTEHRDKAEKTSKKKQSLKYQSLAFARPTLSPSGEIIARMSLVFVSAALLADVAVEKSNTN